MGVEGKANGQIVGSYSGPKGFDVPRLALRPRADFSDDLGVRVLWYCPGHVNAGATTSARAKHHGQFAAPRNRSSRLFGHSVCDRRYSAL